MKSLRPYITRTPDTIRNLAAHISENIVEMKGVLSDHRIDHLYLVGSGTSRNAAYFSRRICSRLLGVPCFVYSAMQFADTVDYPGENSVVIGISQAGHSFSTLLALEKARKMGCIGIAVSNDKNAMIKKPANAFLWIDMPEEDIGPKTEGLYASVATVVLAISRIAADNGLIDNEKADRICQELLTCTDRIAEISDAAWMWNDRHQIRLSLYDDILVLGADDCYPSAMEGALKILETTKLTVRSYETEEFMHGIYHAIDRNKMVLAIAEGKHYERTIRLLGYLHDHKQCDVCAISAEKTDSLPCFTYAFDRDNPFVALEYLAFFQTLAQFMAESRGIDFTADSDPGFHRYMGSYVYEGKKE